MGSVKLLVPLDSKRFRMVPPGHAMTSSFVWNRILLLSSFYKELIIERRCLCFCKRDKKNPDSQRIYVCINSWRKFAYNNLSVLELSLWQRLFKIGEIGGTLLKKNGVTKKQIYLHNKNVIETPPKSIEFVLVSNSFDIHAGTPFKTTDTNFIR